jgi:hypothetical protein
MQKTKVLKTLLTKIIDSILFFLICIHNYLKMLLSLFKQYVHIFLNLRYHFVSIGLLIYLLNRSYYLNLNDI